MDLAMAATETKCQVKVGVGIEALWTSITKDFISVKPKIYPSIDKLEVIEGDGGLGSVFLFHFDIHKLNLSIFPVNFSKMEKMEQKEKIVELDESEYKYALQVVEGLTLRKGFSALTTYFQMSAVGEKETLVDVKVVYEPLIDQEATSMAEIAIKPGVDFILLLEKHLLQIDSA